MAKSDRQAWEEMVRLKKHRQGLDTKEEEASLFPERPAPLEPKGFSEKWKNYWYHYKTVTWVAAGALLAVGVCAVNIAMRPNYDMTIALPMEGYLEEQQVAKMEEYLSSLAPDMNGDGKSQVCLIAMPGVGKDMTQTQKLSTLLAAGEFSMMITDQKTFDQYFGEHKDLLINLSEKYPTDQRVTEDGVCWSLKDSTLVGDGKESDPSQQLFLCLRELKDAPFTSKGKAEQVVSAAVQLMDAIHRANLGGTK